MCATEINLLERLCAEHCIDELFGEQLKLLDELHAACTGE